MSGGVGRATFGPFFTINLEVPLFNKLQVYPFTIFVKLKRALLVLTRETFVEKLNNNVTIKKFRYGETHSNILEL